MREITGPLGASTPHQLELLHSQPIVSFGSTTQHGPLLPNCYQSLNTHSIQTCGKL